MGSLESRAARLAEAEARCLSRARRWIDWNSVPEAWNSRESFCWVYFCDACQAVDVSFALCRRKMRGSIRSDLPKSIASSRPRPLP